MVSCSFQASIAKLTFSSIFFSFFWRFYENYNFMKRKEREREGTWYFLALNRTGEARQSEFFGATLVCDLMRSQFSTLYHRTQYQVMTLVKGDELPLWIIKKQFQLGWVRLVAEPSEATKEACLLPRFARQRAWPDLTEIVFFLFASSCEPRFTRWSRSLAWVRE